MMSGMRNVPPISTSSPRETTTSVPRDRAARQSRTAPALLFTTRHASAPVRAQRSSSTWALRWPLAPLVRSYSRLL